MASSLLPTIRLRVKWVYFVVPVLLTLGLSGYVYWFAEPTRDLRVVGESPFSWSRPPVRTGPAVEIALSENYEGRNGEQEARDDIGRGKLVFFAIGDTPPWHDIWGEEMKRRFGVEVRTIAEPMVSDSQEKFFETYNDVVWKHLCGRFGSVKVNDTAWEAKKMFQQRPAKKG